MQGWPTNKNDSLFRMWFEHSKWLLYDIHKVTDTYEQKALVKIHSNYF